MQSPLLTVREVSKSFAETRILENVSFDVAAGEIVGIWGRNVSGKTTLANILCGELRPDSGEIRVAGEAVRLQSVEQAKKAGVGVLFGDVELVEPLSIAENLMLGNMHRLGFGPGGGIVRRSRIRKTARELCAKFDLDVDVDDPVRILSLPERQQVNLLRMVFQAPRLLVVDDAFSALGGVDLERAFAILAELAAAGGGIAFLSHNHRQLRAACPAIMKLENGALSPRLAPDEFSRSLPKTEASVRTIPKLRAARDEVVFSCQNLCYKQIIRNVSFDLRRGEVLGILGAGNSGRTTMARVLYGDLPSSLGRITVNGEIADIRGPGAAPNSRIALMLDDSNRFSLIPGADLTRNITLNRYSNRIVRSGFVVSGPKERLEAQIVADRLGIKRSDMAQRADELSASSQKLVVLGRWLTSRCDVFLLDEPTQRLDAPGKLQIYNVINELGRQGKGVILFTSDIHESQGICDRILTLRDGRITGEFPAGQADFDKLHEKIFG